MGQTLSEPVTEKHSTEDGDERLRYGVSSMQGWRITMEDSHTTILKMAEAQDVAFFAVFDGHGGASTAKYAGRELHKRIAQEGAFAKKDYIQALKNGFLGADIDLRSDPDFKHEPSGCTAVAIIITQDRILCSNAGDSRAVMSVGGVVKALSHDHKPTNQLEIERIVNAGGFVEFGRVNGNLALSRALGDFEFKKNANLPPEQQIVTADPEITEHVLGLEDEFVVVACDGIWDCMTSQEVVDFVRQGIAQKYSLSIICEKMMDRCLATDGDTGTYGCDNMTIIIIALLQGKTQDDWSQWITGRCGNKNGTTNSGDTTDSEDAMEDGKPGVTETKDEVPSV